MQQVRTPPSLNYFSIFAPHFGSNEKTRYQQLLYFHSQTPLPDEIKLKHIGLAQALINFSKAFSPQHPCQSVHTEKQRLCFLQPEPGYWILLELNLGFVTRTKKGEDARVSMHYIDSQPSDYSLEAILKQAYRLFRLYNGSFIMNVREYGLQTLKAKLAGFFEDWLSQWGFESLSVLNHLDGIPLLPVTKEVHTLLHSFINRIESNFGFISSTYVLWRGMLLWGGNKDFKPNVLYKFLTKLSESSPISSSVPINSGPGYAESVPFSMYLPKHTQISSVPNAAFKFEGNVKTTKLYLGEEDNLHYMLYYELSKDWVIAFLITQENEDHIPQMVQTEFVKSLHSIMKPQLTEILEAMNTTDPQGASNIRALDQKYPYIFYSSLDCALRTNLGGEAKHLMVTSQMVECINQMQNDFIQSRENLQETFVRSSNGFWVIGKRTSQHTFYIIFYKGDSSWADMNEEANHVQKELETTFFLPSSFTSLVCQ